MEHPSVHQWIGIVGNACWLLSDSPADVQLFPVKMKIVTFFERVVDCIGIVVRHETVAEMEVRGENPVS